ncbi:type I-PGING CRISPR-associated protein Cas7/Csp1 [Phaeodactylibacter luteus]|uniref:Type I-PGING CRISPR-associated protein Cas7/Csp1 n=1 Tax=Phaeodactylibacter luteus TaxID=1564516 RepID=A0A5C6RLK0_9BACT|nr:type I-PGING CRISPR-associated protein Cas7/Csp1 [Phaeodactylibacter luteus]TXB62834.1 type I-PGING CRISPR-associated protein Cas7/Csp1 [Phaeodactylibacter luteus]
MEIKNILVSLLAPFENHIANGGEKILGNASSIKRTPDGRVYISGQMQRHALFTAMERLNEADPDKGETYVSNGDGVTNYVEKDLRADMGGFMHPSKNDYSGRRTAPISATMAISISSNPADELSLEESKIARDLLIRLKQDDSSTEGAKKQALATKEFSAYDLMHMNFSLDIGALSISKGFEYGGKSMHLGSTYFLHADAAERKRRARLFLEAAMSLNDYANQARNMVSGEPQQVLIVFDNKVSRKAARFFQANEKERENILAELRERKARVFYGNDKEGDTSVFAAKKQAITFLMENALFNPAGETSNVVPYATFAGEE